MKLKPGDSKVGTKPFSCSYN